MDVPTAGPRAGTMLGGRYVLDVLIGTGGSGEVWRATDEVLDREVALKLLRSDVAEDPAMSRSIEREARHAAGLTAAGIPAIYDVGVHEGRPYLVMELVRGESLADRVRREGPLSARVAVDVAAAAAEAVDSVHRAGVVHRDVKPANLLLGDDGRVRLTDFGIAGRTDPDVAITGHMASLGTVQYVAPERAQGADPDPASDTYALGVVAYELLAGRPPFEGESAAVLLAHVSTLPPPLPDSVPAGVRAAVMRALRKDPTTRQPSAAVFAQELRAGWAQVPASADVDAFDESTEHAATATLPAVVTGGPGSGGTAVLPVARGARRSRVWAVAVPALFGLIVLATLALAVRTSDGVPGPATDPTVAPTAPILEPIPDDLEPAPAEVPAPAAPAAPAVPPEDEPGNGNGRGNGNGNGRGGRDG